MVLPQAFLPLENISQSNAISQNRESAMLQASQLQDIKSIKKAGQIKIRADEVVVKIKGENKHRKIKISKGQTVDQALAEYRSRNDIVYAEPNYIVEALMVPNDTYFGYQWHLDSPVYGGINVKGAWDHTQGQGVTVAVIDTGIAYESYIDPVTRKNFSRAPDFSNTCFVQGYDFVSNDTHANDDNSHGTHVAGTIAQSTNDSYGTAGVAFKACLMPIKVLDSNGSGSYSDVADGIRYAADNGAKVINLSLGGSAPVIYLEEALAYAYSKGVTIVAASGNDSLNTVGYPAAYNDYVIAVGATRYDETRSSYSNYGSALDIVAPGGDTAIDQNGDGYVDGVLQNTFNPTTKNVNDYAYYFFQETSMATPHVAGVAALVISKGNATSPANVREALQSTADDLGTSGRDNTYGFGLVNAEKAVLWTPVVTPPPPTPTPVPPPPPSEIEIFKDSFEVSEWNGLWTESNHNDWFRSTQRSTDGTRSAEVDGSANGSWISSANINLQGKTNATVTFSWFIESSLDAGEYVAFDVSTNGGATWTQKKIVRGNVDSENTWHNVSIDLNGISQLKLRFRGKMSASSEDANIDNIKVIAF